MEHFSKEQRKICFLSIAIMLFLSFTPYGWNVFHVVTWWTFSVFSLFLSEADWLSLWIFMTESRAGEGSAL